MRSVLFKMSADLEPVVMLLAAKRPRIERLDWLCCLLCQSYESGGVVSNATDGGADKVKKSYQIRRKCEDVTATFKTFMDNNVSDIDCLVEKRQSGIRGVMLPSLVEIM